MQKAPDELLTVDEIAAQLGVNARTVRREVARGDLAYPVKVGRLARWFRSDVNAYLDKIKKQRPNDGWNGAKE